MSASHPSPEPLTVSEAAAALRVSERTLRRLLAERADLAARLVERERRTVSGVRPARALPPDLLADVAAALKIEVPPFAGVPATGPAEVAATTPAGTQADTGTAAAGTPADGGTTAADAGETGPTTQANIGANGTGTAAETGTRRHETGRNTGGQRRRVARRPADGGDAGENGGGRWRALLAEKDARIADLSAEVERWNRAHDQAQQLQLAALAEVAEWRRRAAELESTNARLVAVLPAAPVATAPHETAGGEGTPRSGVEGVTTGDTSRRIAPAGAAGDTQSGDGDPARVSAPPGASPVKKAGLLSRWFGGGWGRGGE